MLVPIHASGVSAKIRRAPKRFQTADKKSVPIGRHLDLETRGGESAREGLACGRFLSSCTQRNVGGADSSGGQGCGRQRKEIRRCEAFRESRPIVCVEQDEVMEVAVGYEVQDCVCGMNPSFPCSHGSENGISPARPRRDRSRRYRSLSAGSVCAESARNRLRRDRRAGLVWAAWPKRVPIPRRASRPGSGVPASPDRPDFARLHPGSRSASSDASRRLPRKSDRTFLIRSRADVFCWLARAS